MSEPTNVGSSSGTGFWNVIENQLQQARDELQEGEVVRILVRTPDGAVQVSNLDSSNPMVFVAHLISNSRRRRTVIAPIESVQLIIEVLPQSSKEAPRQLGFSLPE